MTLTFEDVQRPLTAPQWLQTLIDDGATLGLKATAWQSGSIARTILAIVAESLKREDIAASLMAMGGFLDFAAEGSITYLDPTGKPVTLVVTPEGGPGWLDLLASSVYDCERIELTYAGGALAICNTSASTYGPLAAGTYHVADPFTRQTYATTGSLTIPPSPLAGTSISAVGSYFGSCQITTSTAHGLVNDQAVAVLGAAGIPQLAGTTFWRVKVLTSTTFILVGSTFSGSYTGGGTVRVPTVATVQCDVGGSVGNSLDATGAAAANVVTQPVTSLVGVSTGNLDPFLGTDVESNKALAARCRLRLQALAIAAPGGAYKFFALSAQQYAAKLNPPQKLGSAITRVRTVTDRSNGTVYVFAANPAGPISPEDRDVADAVIQAFVTPEAVTAKVASATRVDAAVAITIYLPAAYASAANRVIFEQAVQAYISTLDIGGDTDPGGAYTNILPLEGLAGAIFEEAERRVIPVQNLTPTINGAGLDLQLVVNTSLLRADVVVLAPAVPEITLVGV